MSASDRERRANPRVPTHRPVMYQSEIYPKNRMAVTTDLSLSGARIEDASSLYKMERLDLWLSLEPRVISCRGRVVHIQQVGDRFSAGIRFEAMADEDREVLTRYLSQLMEDTNQR